VILTRAIALSLALSALGCMTNQVRTKPAQLRVLAEPTQAAVYVDERFLAVAAKLEQSPASLRPGKRRVTVQSQGYFPHDLVVELVPGVTTIEVKLRPVPP
jgi:hypothetical protein